jgi:hypothetical protein
MHAMLQTDGAHCGFILLAIGAHVHVTSSLLDTWLTMDELY